VSGERLPCRGDDTLDDGIEVLDDVMIRDAQHRIYDVRARQWSPEMLFLAVDEYRYFSPKTTLWAWPGMNPVRLLDPSGRTPLLPPFPPFPPPKNGMTPEEYCETQSWVVFFACTLLAKLPPLLCASVATKWYEECKKNNPDPPPENPPNLAPKCSGPP
jgi:hypothetical protein